MTTTPVNDTALSPMKSTQTGSLRQTTRRPCRSGCLLARRQANAQRERGRARERTVYAAMSRCRWGGVRGEGGSASGRDVLVSRPPRNAMQRSPGTVNGVISSTDVFVRRRALPAGVAVAACYSVGVGQPQAVGVGKQPKRNRKKFKQLGL